mgnify:CR=1 FL=1
MLCNRFVGKSQQECAKVVKQIPIIHVHGKLGDLSWEKNGGMPYYPHPRIGENILEQAHKSIRIIGGEVAIDTDNEFKKAHDALELAKRIYFLGFGYNEVNLNTLRITKYSDRPEVETIGTAIGLTPPRLGALKRKFKHINFFEGIDIFNLLKNYRPLNL